MSKELYCWRCRMILPMLDEQEYSRLEPLLSQSLRNVKKYREEHGASIGEALSKAQQPALDEYFRITGFHETNVNALFHHRLSLLGPPCGECGKPLRTPKAKHCAACGTDRAKD